MSNEANESRKTSLPNRYADLIQVMNYDFHVFSITNPLVGLNAPLRNQRLEPFLLNEMNSVRIREYYDGEREKKRERDQK